MMLVCFHKVEEFHIAELGGRICIEWEGMESSPYMVRWTVFAHEYCGRDIVRYEQIIQHGRSSQILFDDAWSSASHAAIKALEKLRTVFPMEAE